MSLIPGKTLECKLLTRDLIDRALAIQIETMQQENLAIGVGMFEEPGAVEEMSLVFKEIIKDGATLIVLDQKTNEVAGVAFNKIHARPKKGEKDKLGVFIEENLKHRSCRELIKFLDDIESSLEIFETYDVNGAMELFYLGTNPRYQGHGIGSYMVQKCIEYGRGLLNGTIKRTSIDGDSLESAVVPELIYGVFASNYSQRIADKFNFVSVHEVQYNDYNVTSGKRMSDRLGTVNRSARFQVLKL